MANTASSTLRDSLLTSPFHSDAYDMDESTMIAESLRSSVVSLVDMIGERNMDHYEALCAAADYIERRFKTAGLTVSRQVYEVDGRECFNIVGEVGYGHDIFVIGAHYDSIQGPGANDNATGVAILLQLARDLPKHAPRLTKRVRLVAFTNEEAPFVRTSKMGSLVYAQQCKELGEDIIAMISLETLGYFPAESSSGDRDQQHPHQESWFQRVVLHPARDSTNFVSCIGNLSSWSLVNSLAGIFRAHSKFPIRSAALPGFLPGEAGA